MCLDLYPPIRFFKSETGSQAKLVFADQSFIYGLVSDWTINNTHFDGCKPTWEQEPKVFLGKERKPWRSIEYSILSLRLKLLFNCFI